MTDHHDTRIIAYPRCPARHVVEFYHAHRHCNATRYSQTGPCVNTPHSTDNPLGLRATHYRMGKCSDEDACAVGGANDKCPVCEREELERVWVENMRSIDGVDGVDAIVDNSDGGDNDYSRPGRLSSKILDELQSKLWVEMPFRKIWLVEEFIGEDWADGRPYKNVLRGRPLSGRGEPWPLGEYKGMNHRRRRRR